MPPRASFVAAEVAFVVSTGRSASLVAAEVAISPAHVALALLVAEVAGTFPPPPPSVAIRTATGNEVRTPW